MRVAHNITALNAWRNLSQVGDQLGKSVQRISSGYRINRAGDDPAGLVISENLRAQVVGMDQALSNTQDGVSMIQTAEGALTEIHSLLDSMRSLALHAANTAGLTAEAIAADQEQLDSAIDSIDRIATTTAYAGKKLLDGTAGNKATIFDATHIGEVKVGEALSGTYFVNVEVTTKADRAVVTGTLSYASGGMSVGSGGNLVINGVNITIASGTTVNSAVTIIENDLNTYLGSGVISVSWTSGSGIQLQHSQYGDAYSVEVNDQAGVILTAGQFTSDSGQDIAGTINGSAATGDGLKLTADQGTNYAGMELTLTLAGNTAATYSNAIKVVSSDLTFQVGANKGEVYTTSIGNMKASRLGSNKATNGLNDLKSSQLYSLANDAQTAIEVIDQAISDVSTERAKLGAIQTNVLESNYRNLGSSRENLQSSESRIRDVDMAREMMEFTKNQVLTQAATAMLAQANTLPQNVLTLLR